MVLYSLIHVLTMTQAAFSIVDSSMSEQPIRDCFDLGRFREHISHVLISFSSSSLGSLICACWYPSGRPSRNDLSLQLILHLNNRGPVKPCSWLSDGCSSKILVWTLYRSMKIQRSHLYFNNSHHSTFSGLAFVHSYEPTFLKAVS